VVAIKTATAYSKKPSLMVNAKQLRCFLWKAPTKVMEKIWRERVPESAPVTIGGKSVFD